MPVKQYKLRERKIEAIQYTGDNFDECVAFVKDYKLEKGAGGNGFYIDKWRFAARDYCPEGFFIVRGNLGRKY